jgi:hypothetical protein
MTLAKQNSGRLHKPLESNRASASLVLLIKEFFIFVFTFWVAGLYRRGK